MQIIDVKLNEAFDGAPEKLQDYIMSQEVGKVIDVLIAEHGILEEEIFRKHIFALLVGLESAEDFMIDSVKDFSLDEREVDMLYVDIDESILAQARKILADSPLETPVPTPEKPQPEIPTNLPMMPEEHELAQKKDVVSSFILKPELKPEPKPEPVQATRPAPSILDARLQSSVNLPPVDIDINKKDPYREPIE